MNNDGPMPWATLLCGVFVFLTKKSEKEMTAMTIHDRIQKRQDPTHNKKATVDQDHDIEEQRKEDRSAL